MPETHVIEQRVNTVAATRGSRRRLFGVAGASALAFAGLRLPKADRAAAQVSAQAVRTYVNSNPITIRDQNTALPYPSIINVTNMPGSIVDGSGVRVRLRGLTHDKVSDVAVAVVSPTGTAVFIMGDVGGDTAVIDLNLLIFQNAPNGFNQTSLVSGSYRPQNFGAPGNNSIFPSPAPAPIPNQSLNQFSGLAGNDLNGAWRLFVFDDARLGAGTISRGWELELTTTNTPPEARTDRYSTRVNETLRVRAPGVLRNDRDEDRDSLRVIPFSQNSSVGRIRVRKNGALTFRPKNNKRGKAEFEYTVEDQAGGTDTGKIVITVK